MKKITEFLSENKGQSPIEFLVSNGYTPADIDEAVENAEIKIEGYNAILIEKPVKEQKKPIKNLVPKVPTIKKAKAIPAPETIEQPKQEPKQPKEEKAPEIVPNGPKSSFEKYSFERLQKLEARIKKAKFSDKKELERIWNKYILKLRGWVNLSDNCDSKPEWIEYCKKNNLDPDYIFYNVFPIK